MIHIKNDNGWRKDVRVFTSSHILATQKVPRVTRSVVRQPGR